MTERPLHIVSVNMNRQRTMDALLQDSQADILLVQEPWFFNIVPKRSDHNPAGTPVLGPMLNPRWEVYLPSHDPMTDTCNVAIYARSSLCALPPHSFSILPRPSHPWSSLSCMVVDITISGEVLRLINVYHQVQDSKLSDDFRRILTSPPPSPHLPHLIAGDLNTHSRTWSLPTATTSPWAQSVDHWLVDHDYQLVSETDNPTWRSHSDPRLVSIINVLLLNTPAVLSDQFSTTLSSFVDSYGSDHAALSISWTPLTAIPTFTPLPLPGFKIDDSLKDTWIKNFAKTCLITPIILDGASTSYGALSLEQDILDTSAAIFPRRTTADPRGARWWNPDCSAAVSIYKAACALGHRQRAITGLRSTLMQAKRSWSQSFLSPSDPHSLWKATRWRHGCRTTSLPTLSVPGSSDNPSPEPHHQAGILHAKFFSLAPAPVSLSQPDDPAPLPTRDLHDVTEDEVLMALSTTSNSSAPGVSGIGYKLLKWAFAACPSCFVDLFNGCLTHGIHPWHTAKVIPVPKPNKPDYGVAAAYRPISLLECWGKLLEKIVASRVLHDASLHPILPSHQFGSRSHHCAVDAALAVVHTAQLAIKQKLVCSMLLFDIQGFFDNIHVDRLCHLFALFGFPPSLCDWLHSFLSDRQVRIQVNAFLSDAAPLSHGIPQGSPISPILSAIYTAPLLFSLQQTLGRDVYMYVDDGAIVTTGRTRRHAAMLAAQGLEHVSGWLARNGLRIAPEKTEFISFAPPNWSSDLFGAPFSHLDLRTPHSEFSVPVSHTVRYLGIFLDDRLSWSHHISTLATRTCSTILTLGVLGNSIRGISYGNWRRVFHSIIIPTLTYGAALWYTGTGQKGLTGPLQVAQNDAIRKMCGVFRTTPTAPLHHVANILPITYRLRAVRDQFMARMKSLPPSHILLMMPPHIVPCRNPIPTSLTSVLPTTCVYVPNAAPWSRLWTHPRCITLKDPPAFPGLLPDRLSIFIYPLYLPDHPSSCFLIYRGSDLLTSQSCTEPTLLSSLFTSLTVATGLCISFERLPTYFYIPSSLASLPLFSLRKHSHVRLSTSLTDSLSALLDEDTLTIRFSSFLAKKPKKRPHDLTSRPFSASWPGIDPPALSHFLQCPPGPPPTLPSTPAVSAYAAWAADYAITGRSPAWKACVPSQGPSFTIPFLEGVLPLASRRLLCTCLQLLFDHAFTASYSDRFRPSAGDNTDCPCGRSYITQDGLSLPFRNTLHHGLFQCHDRDDACDAHLPFTSLDAIFTSARGGAALCKYIHASQAFLRPPPPRPDPP